MKLRATMLCALVLTGACATLDSFLFEAEPVDDYGWDDDPCDPTLTGDLSVAEHERLGGPEPTCHPSKIPPENRTEGFVDADGNEIHYVYAERPGATTTIFYSHGNKHHIGNYWERVELMWEMGYNVMIYDYPGYGRSSGEPDEAGCYAAAQAVLERLPSMPGVDVDRVFFYGFSLGGGITYEMGVRGVRDELAVRPRGLVSESSFCSVQALVQDGSYIDLSASFLSQNRFDNCAKIDEVATAVPVMIIHGDIDHFVVPRHAKLLLDSTDEDIEMHWAQNAMHSDIPVMVPDAYAGWLDGFLGQ
jgi:dienelactone hydrolase